MMLHIPPEDVPDGDVLEIEVRSEHFRVSSLAAALNSHDDVFPHAASFARNGPAGSAQGGNSAARDRV
jgi:hypothetical protein